MNLRKSMVAGLTALAAALPLSTAFAGFQFTSFDGPGDHSAGTSANGIGNNGSIVGFSMGAGGALTNFIRNPDATFTMLNINGSTAAMANGLNASNLVVGGDGNNNAFLLSGTNVTTLPPANPGKTASKTAFGINDAGIIVGQYTNSTTGKTPGFVYNGTTFTILNPMAGSTVTNAQGINNNGLVTGFYSVLAGGAHSHGFLYDSATKTFSFPKDPVTSNIDFTQFLGVNDKDIAVGYWQTLNGSQHGFLYDIASMTYTFLDDPLAALNNNVTITQITGINNSGELTGFYVGADGLQHGFIATAFGVPEPGSLVLLGIGLAGIVTTRRLRRRPGLRT